MNLRKTLSTASVQDWIFGFFSVFWVIAVVLDYLNKQILYIPSITHFKYGLLFSVLLVVGCLLSASYTRVGFLKKLPPLRVNGLLIVVLITLCVWAIVAAYNVHWKAPLGIKNYLHLAFKVFVTLGGAFIITLAAFSVGRLIRTRLVPVQSTFILTYYLLDIAIGFLLYSLVMMLLGALGFLQQYILLGCIFLFIVVNIKESLRFSKKVLWSPIKKPLNLSFFGGLVAFLILVYISMNYLYTQAPFPLGFDARNYYVNIAKLISETGHLVEGFQPYAWSLVMSTGFIAFNSPETSMFISVLGGLLSLVAIYDLSKNHIGINSNYSFLVTLLYLVTPTVTNHFIIEFKIDLTLVFVQIVTLSFFLSWIKDKVKNQKMLYNGNEDRNKLIVIGLLLGFCLSIKVLSLFLIIAFVVSIWWLNRDIYGVIGTALCAIGFILILRLDELSGLRSYHLSPSITGLISIALGLASLVISFLKSKAHFFNISKSVLIIGISALLVFSPWVYKNYTYTKSSSLMKLIIGDKPRPQLTVKDIEKNYINSQNEQNNE